MMAASLEPLFKTSSIDTLELPRVSVNVPMEGLGIGRRSSRGNLPPRLPLMCRPSQRNNRELFEPQGFAQTADPWSFYTKLVQTNQAGPAFLACHLLSPFPVRVVKEVEFPSATIPQRVVQPSHPNIVNLIEIFIGEKSLHMIYERMEISLAQIPATSWEEIADADVAFVCREVI